MKKNYYPSAESARLAAAVVISAGLLAACGGNDSPATNSLPIGGNNSPATNSLPIGGNDSPATNSLPIGVTQLSLVVYPATVRGTGDTAATQDLLTAGLGRTGVAGASRAYANPLAPTAFELRRNSIQANYKGAVDVTTNGGYGSLYGPNLDVAQNVTASEGLIPGREYLAALDDGTGRKRVAMAVQIPDSFNQAAPCVVVGPSSGSRGVYGAIGTAAEWALKNGCVAALTDAGKGVGLYDLTDDTVNRIDGTRATRLDAGVLNFFAANITDAARLAYNALFPNRVAIKQVHSQLNPEKDWGNDTLAAARYALYALNDRYGTAANPVPFNAANTIIIGASVSNGGGAVLKAAEQDTSGLIDGVVAGEPNAQPSSTAGYGIQFGGVPITNFGKTLADYVTYGNLYQPCAALAAPALMAEVSTFNLIANTPNYTARATARCDGLAAKGFVAGADTAARSLDALNKLRAFGWTPDNDTMHSAHWALGNGPILAAMYPVSYGKFSVADNVCNTSFAQVDATGIPIQQVATAKAQSFAVGNGTANGGAGGATPGVVYNDSVGGARLWTVATSPSTGVQDFGLDNAICQRALVTGVDFAGNPLTAATMPTATQSAAVRAGIAEVLFNGNAQGKPVIIVAGRSDALLPINNNARAYVAYNRSVEGAASKLRYIEVTNAQHFDGFLGLGGFDTRYIPLHAYFVRAMDAMYANLKNGTALPPSQVVRTTVRGGTPGAAPAITGANVPAINAAPAAGEQIGFAGTSLAVPN